MSRATRHISRNGGHILADQLKVQGVEKVFCVPGESFLDLLDGLYDHRKDIGVIATRHESAAANMAEAYGKLTGRPGVCAVTRGPGATNAANGLHTAFQDSTPMVLLIGQVGREFRGREAFQEMDYRNVFGEMAKGIEEIRSAADIPETVARAFRLAASGRPGPVVLSLPEDILGEAAEVADADVAVAEQAAPRTQDMEDLGRRLEAAERPVLMLGGATWTAGAVADISRFTEAWGLPVVTSFRCQDRFDNRHDQYAGHAGIAINPKLAERIKSCDLLVACGPRLGEMTTQGYTIISPPEPKQSLVHVHPGAEELGRVFKPALGIHASMGNFAAAAAEMPPPARDRWQDWRQAARDDYLEHIEPTQVPGAVNPGEVVQYLNQTLADDAVITNGAGNYTVWVQRFYQYRDYGTQLAPTSGSMGYGVPAAIAAKLMHPGRDVVCFAGDGCFLMLGQELATARQYGANVIFIVVNNGTLGTIRMHQERRYPGRVLGTDLENPDFAAFAESFGAYGVRVTRTGDFAGAFDAAKNSGKPALIELVVDANAITPTLTLDDLRRTCGS